MYIKMMFQDDQSVMEVGEADNDNKVRISIHHIEDEQQGWFIELDARAVSELRDWLVRQLELLDNK